MNANGATGGAGESDEIPAPAPFFSVLIPNYNGVRHLPDLFAGLASQSFTDFEVIFADDASSDDSVAWVQASARQARILAGGENKGFVGTVNRAAREGEQTGDPV